VVRCRATERSVAQNTSRQAVFVIRDTRDKLLVYMKTGLLTPGGTGNVPKLAGAKGEDEKD
jgi:hypothetical protein